MENQLHYEKFDQYINKMVAIIKGYQLANPLLNYHFPDSIDFHNNMAIYKILKDTIKLLGLDGKEYSLMPYGYDFNDFFGRENWSNMFVTKLLYTHKGNCHSLPYLYKILADEIGASCWLTLAPDHIYIQNRCKKTGWYNVELTSGSFPVDGWIMASGYLPLQAVQSGIYMDTLGNRQSIALCILDLAKEYESQVKNYDDGFIIDCCNLVLYYNPNNAQAILLKAETLKRIYQRETKEQRPMATDTYTQMEQLYVKLFDLGYREMPEKMYMDWLLSVNKEQAKYENKKVTGAMQLKKVNNN